MGKVMVVNDDNFESEVVQFSGVVLVDFFADWCGPCRYLAPTIEKLSEEYAADEKVKFVKLNVDEARAAAVKYGIRAIPTIVVFKDGAEADRLQGVQPAEQIKTCIDGLK